MDPIESNKEHCDKSVVKQNGYNNHNEEVSFNNFTDNKDDVSKFYYSFILNHICTLKIFLPKIL